MRVETRYLRTTFLMTVKKDDWNICCYISLFFPFSSALAAAFFSGEVTISPSRLIFESQGGEGILMILLTNSDASGFPLVPFCRPFFVRLDLRRSRQALHSRVLPLFHAPFLL